MGEWLTIAEAAQVAGVSTATLRRWDRSGRLPAVRHPISGYRMYLRDRVDSLTPAATAPPEPAGPPLLGRKHERTALLSLAERHRLVVVTGPPGIGKTQLTNDVLARMAGALSVDCSDVVDLPGFFAAIAQALGSGASEPQLLRTLRARPCVLGLDNLEQLLDLGVPEVLSRWLQQAPELRLLVTSREALRIAPEHLLSLGPLDARASAQLFRRATDGDWPPEAVDELVDRLEGNPLALELAAAQAELLGPAELLSQLGAGTLTTDRRDVPARHASVKRAVDASLQRRTPEERRALSQLLVFRGGFGAAAATAVLDLTEPLAVLRALQRASLLRTWTVDGERRHAPWVIVRDVVAASDPPDAEAMVRHARWLAERLADPTREHTHESHNFRAALGREQVPAPLRAEVFGASWALAHTLTRHERIQHCTELLDAEPHTARMLLIRGTAHMDAGHLELAEADLTQGLDHANDDVQRANLLLTRAILWLHTAEADRAHGDLDRAWEVAQRTGSPMLIARALSVRANVITSTEGRRAALEPLREAIQLARRTGRARLEVSSLALATRYELALGTGRLDDALRVVALAREVKDTRFEGYALETVGLLLLESGQLQESLRALADASAACERLGFAEQAARSQVAMAVACLVAGDPDEGEARAREAANVLAPDSLMGQRCRAVIALAAHLGGDPDRALRLIPGDVQSQGAHDMVQTLLRMQGREADAPETADDEDPIVRAVLRIEQGRSRKLRVAPDGTWFELPGRPTVDLSGRPVLARILATLSAAATPVATQALVEAAWPDTTLVADSGPKRVRSAIWTLRKLGLRHHLRTTPEGYRLDLPAG